MDMTPYLLGWLAVGLVTALITHRYARDPLPGGWWLVLTLAGPVVPLLLGLAILGACLVNWPTPTEHAQVRGGRLGSEMDREEGWRP